MVAEVRADPAPLPACHPPPYATQDEADAVTAALAAAVAQYEGARGELGDVYGQWERDREELVEEIRWGVCARVPVGCPRRRCSPDCSWCRPHHCNIILPCSRATRHPRTPALPIPAAGRCTTTWRSRRW